MIALELFGKTYRLTPLQAIYEAIISVLHYHKAMMLSIFHYQVFFLTLFPGDMSNNHPLFFLSSQYML
ncbi:hypothetical protein BIT28_06125 [Photobacterium proteolyticum]|uniref:Uncharacterized protein n=1 Tax=Photobacterium proteolyticum TaxID=1903952 RepID=A0A1Q9GED5_9GAMM|nr:hypothetical protein BIT28_06125 [Photobacterium proteolyticum]